MNKRRIPYVATRSQDLVRAGQEVTKSRGKVKVRKKLFEAIRRLGPPWKSCFHSEQKSEAKIRIDGFKRNKRTSEIAGDLI